jgi:hypothetical protein
MQMMRLRAVFPTTLALVLLVIRSATGNSSDDSATLTKPLPLDQILSQMAASTKKQETALAGYSAFRTYQAGNGLTHTKAWMQVKTVFRSPSTKDFTVVSEDGSNIIRSKVFKRALEAEKEAQRADQKQRSAFNSDNYDFTLAGEEDLRGRHCYVLEAHPKRKDKFLLRSRVWVDAADFAVVRVKGELVKPPSFWTRDVEFMRDYQKMGDFWLPMRDESSSQLLIFGKSTMTITYDDYAVETAVEPKATAENQISSVQLPIKR